MQLFIHTYGAYLHVKEEMFDIRIKQGEEIVHKQFSARKVSTIVLADAASLSTDAIQLALKYHIDIVITERTGRPLGRFWHSKLGSTTLIRKQQLIASIGKQGMTDALNWIDKKLVAHQELLERLKKHRSENLANINEAIDKIETLRTKINGLTGECMADIADTLRGYEGNAGKIFYETLSTLLPKNHQFAGRSARPAKDPFNAFLNYANGILYSRIEKALILAGLDPYVGYMHRDDYNQLSFVFDFIEPYRTFAIEPVFKLFSGKKVNKEHTTPVPNGMTLNKEGKALLVAALTEYWDEEAIRYRGRNQTRNRIIMAEAHEYANKLIGRDETELIQEII